MQLGKNGQHSVIDFAPGPQGMRFVAAVRFRRSQVTFVKAEGWEREQNLNTAPNITWWWYDVDLVPETVLIGSWDEGRGVTLKCRHYLATSSDTSWIGIIVKDVAGKERWLKEYALQEGQVVDPMQRTVIGTEAELERIIIEYLQHNHLEPYRL